MLQDIGTKNGRGNWLSNRWLTLSLTSLEILNQSCTSKTLIIMKMENW